jgi:hypothetical protein
MRIKNIRNPFFRQYRGRSILMMNILAIGRIFFQIICTSGSFFSVPRSNNQNRPTADIRRTKKQSFKTSAQHKLLCRLRALQKNDLADVRAGN